MQIITKEYARSQGWKKYFTGEACSQGHLDMRYVVSDRCVECVRLAKLGVPPTRTGKALLDAVARLINAAAPTYPHRVQTDGNGNVWIDGLWIGQWADETARELEIWQALTGVRLPE